MVRDLERVAVETFVAPEMLNCCRQDREYRIAECPLRTSSFVHQFPRISGVVIAGDRQDELTPEAGEAHRILLLVPESWLVHIELAREIEMIGETVFPYVGGNCSELVLIPLLQR